MKGLASVLRHNWINASIALILLISPTVNAQNIPLGTWRTHLSYHNITCVTVGDQKVFASGNHGVITLDQTDNSISSYSKINGLNGTTVTYISYDIKTKRLLIAYGDGKFDVVDGKTQVYGFDPTQTSSITGSKKINHIFISEGLAYLAADYGVIVFDINRMLVKETWRGLGSAGQVLTIFQSTILGDSIFLATAKGVLAGALKDNLQDFNSWKRFETGDFNGQVQHISHFDNTVYSAVNGSGLFRYEEASWVKLSVMAGSSFVSANPSNDNLFIAEAGGGLFKLTANEELIPIADDLVDRPNFGTEDANGKIWVGDGDNGLVTNASGEFTSVIPNSPSGDKTFNLTYNNRIIYAQAGGYASNRIALGNRGTIDKFVDGTWANEETSLRDLTAIVFQEDQDKIFISSFGYGVEVRDGQSNSFVFNDTNSPLINLKPPDPFVYISSLASAENGLWVANYGASKPLHFLDANGSWKSFSFALDQSKYPLKLAVDQLGQVWMALDPLYGGGLIVFDEAGNDTVWLTDIPGQGGLPSNSVNAITIDKDGSVWIGTDLGVAYFNDPSSVFDGNVNAVKPIFDDRFLLREDKITSIAIDGGNRKWIGTERGLWLFNDSGEELIHNFTTTNSPLLSDVIRDIEVNGETGEVFVATNEGLLSFRADATEGGNAFETVKVFPNPVTAEFAGSIGISGLAVDALVKITDINGKLIWQTRANGGTASWNLQDINGRRPATGVYIVFTVTDNGDNNAVAKIAFVD